MTSVPPTASALANMLSHLSPATVPRDAVIHALKPFSDFKALCRHCDRHGISPLVYRNAKDLNLLTAFPENARDHLQKAYYRTLSNNLAYLEALREIAQNLSSSISVAVLKGPVLLNLVYQNPALRPLSDIDLLVQPADRPSLQKMVRQLGYAPNVQYPEIFTRGAIILDLHTDVLNATRIEARRHATPLTPRALWQNMQPMADFSPLQQLRLEDQIVTLAIHGLKHGFNRKIWLIDLTGCLSKIADEESWNRVLHRAETARAKGILAMAVHAIQMHLSHPLPTFAKDLQKSFPIGPISLKILQIGQISDPFQILEPLVMIVNQSGIRPKVAFLWEMAFPRRDVLAQISGFSGPLTFWLSYPYRLIQLITLGFAQLTKMMLRSMRNTPD